MENWSIILIAMLTLLIGVILGTSAMSFAADIESSELTDSFGLELNSLNETIQSKDNEIIVLRESNEYNLGVLRVERNQTERLQETFNDLFVDGASCYWANRCLYFTDRCEAHFSGDETARQLHEYYSDECDLMISNWDDYVEHDTQESE